MRSKMRQNSAKRGLMAAAAFTAGLALASGASAQALPAATYNLVTFPNGPNGSSPQFSYVAGSISTSTNNIDGVASGSASASSQYVSADVFAAGQNEGIGSATETYYFSAGWPPPSSSAGRPWSPCR
jgi:uncharacterized protein YggE